MYQMDEMISKRWASERKKEKRTDADDERKKRASEHARIERQRIRIRKRMGILSLTRSIYMFNGK